jgi:hypothetical protein
VNFYVEICRVVSHISTPRKQQRSPESTSSNKQANPGERGSSCVLYAWQVTITNDVDVGPWGGVDPTQLKQYFTRLKPTTASKCHNTCHECA